MDPEGKVAIVTGGSSGIGRATAIALAMYSAALVACLGRARRDPAFLPDAIALGLLPVAGLTLDLTYQHLVAIVVLLLLVQPPLAPSDAQDAVLAA